jgi:phenylacetate-CoA ligase
LQSNPVPAGGGERFYFDPAIETMPRQKLEQLQLERLISTIALAYERAPLIRRKWDAAGVHPRDIKSLADFSRLAPFITKDEIRAYREETGDPFGGVLCANPSELRCIQGTSGTTGDPTLISRRDLKAPLMESGLSRDFWDHGLRPGEYGIVINTTMRGSTMSPLVEFGMIPIVLDHDPREIPRMIELIRLYRPTLLMILSNPLLMALEQFERETGMDMASVFAPMKSIAWGGEPLGARGRKLTERWGMKIHEIVSVGDSSITLECSSNTGVHAWEDEVLIEHLDPQTLLPAEDGTFGELVVTPLQNSVDPLVRFRSEDLVWLTREPCVCGRTHVRYKVQGRTGDEVVVEGHYILPRDVWPAIEEVPETSAALFQIVKLQRTMIQLRLRVGYAGSPDLDDLRARVEEQIWTMLSVPCAVELVTNDELLKLGPPHKIPRIVKA